jgi:hypothetical protein
MELSEEMSSVQFLAADLAEVRQPYQRRTASGELTADAVAAQALKGARGWRLLSVMPRGQLWMSARRVGGAIHAPRKVKHVPPLYPDEAKRDGLQGVVVLEC